MICTLVVQCQLFLYLWSTRLKLPWPSATFCSCSTRCWRSFCCFSKCTNHHTAIRPPPNSRLTNNRVLSFSFAAEPDELWPREKKHTGVCWGRRGRGAGGGRPNTPTGRLCEDTNTLCTWWRLLRSLPPLHRSPATHLGPNICKTNTGHCGGEKKKNSRLQIQH